MPLATTEAEELRKAERRLELPAKEQLMEKLNERPEIRQSLIEQGLIAERAKRVKI